MSRDHGRRRAFMTPTGVASRPVRDRVVQLAVPWLACASVVCALLFAAPGPVSGQSLRGSPASLDIQNRVAREHEYTYIDTAERVRHFVKQGWLVRVKPDQNFDLHAVSFPYARPEVA